MLKHLFFTLLLLHTLNSHAQIYLNPGVDTSGIEVQTALKFYNSYIADFNGKDLPNLSKYWPTKERKQRIIPDQLIYAINSNQLYNQGYQPTILYIKPMEKYIHIKTQFAAKMGENIMTIAITNHYIGTDSKNGLYFINPLTVNMASWQHKTVRNITFFYPPQHQFNSVKADSLIKQIVKLEKDWGLQPINIRYYMANTSDELQILKGFDFNVLMGNKAKPSGISDDIDNQVFCGGLGENYFHEVVHVYLNRLYPKSPIREGLAVFHGGSMGRSINWHLVRVNRYLQQHPEADLNNLDDFWYSDPYTNPSSAISGMICRLIYQKDGINGLKRMMNYTSLQDIFEKELKVKNGQWNDYLRKTIAEQAVK